MDRPAWPQSLLDENAVPTSGMRKAWMGCKVGYVARTHEMGQWMEHVPHSQLCDARARLVNCAGEVGDLSLFSLGGRPRAKERAREVQRDRDRDRATDGRIEKAATCCVSLQCTISRKQDLKRSLLSPLSPRGVLTCRLRKSDVGLGQIHRTSIHCFRSFSPSS